MTATTDHKTAEGKKTYRLHEIQYKVTALKAGRAPVTVLEASITVEDKRVDPAVGGEVTSLNLPDSLLEGSTGTAAARTDPRWCK